ncbi:zinc-binding dehydrogenase [Streptomyces sp. NBC_01314]|uniref:zinc-dependent alcohol dehydrogenase n=1 Tax=Streptomyces sp. NBC_01314 TaxID=2903821 RepID=UPI0030866446|nr:alcohol dehydrogenase catalytic domain-containing protein [Streptomyces sp. NBC_01314]
MTTMPVILLDEQRRIVLSERPVPAPGSGQVLVDVDLCGICGSDLHSPDLPQVYLGGFVLGHEASGVVREVGADVEGWAVGQRVAVNPNGNVCGVCAYCLSGRFNFCHQATMKTALGLQADGALAPVMVAASSTLRALPDAMGRVEAAWVEPTATALRAVLLAGDLAGATVLVSGGGPIGQLVCRIAAHLGAGRVVLVEPTPERRGFAPASRVDVALTPAEAQTRLTHADDPLRADIAIECSGNASATTLALTALRPGGVLVVVGSGVGATLDPLVILLNEITVRGSFTYVDEFEQAIDLLTSKAIRVDDLTTAVVPLSEALAAFESLRAAQTMKILIEPHHSS